MSLFEEMTSSGLQADRGASLTLLKALAMGKQSRAAHALYSQMSAKYTNNTASLYWYVIICTSPLYIHMCFQLHTRRYG